jgi:uncharacterized protein
MAEALTRQHVAEAVERNRERILALGVRRLALFGSIVKNAGRETSDVDLLVEFRPGEKSYERFLDLAELLEQALGTQVDLVTTEGLSPHIGPHILAEAADVLRAA